MIAPKFFHAKNAAPQSFRLTFATQNDVAVTFAPVPSFKRFKSLADVHPVPWLRAPHAGTVRSYTSWRQKIDKKT